MNHLIQEIAPYARLLGTVSLVSGVLWVGALFTTSWLCSRARLMADGPEVGRLAVLLYRQWATRCLAVGALSGLLAVAGAPDLSPGRAWATSAATALLALLWLHARVGAHAARIAREGARGPGGQAGDQVALIASLALLAVLVTFRSVLAR